MNFIKVLPKILVFCLIIFISVCLQALGTAMIVKQGKEIIVYNFSNYSLFIWVIQILYWAISLCASFLLSHDIDH